MRFGQIHRVLLDLLAALGMLGLATTGELDKPALIALFACFAAALAVPRAWQERPLARALGTYAPVALFFVQIVRWMLGANPLTLAIEFAAVLQLFRIATRRGAAHDTQIVALALLHMIAATMLGGGLLFAFCFVAFIVVTPPALVLSHLRREVEGNYRQGARDRTGLPVDVPRILRSRRVVGRGFLAFTASLSLPILLFTALLFAVFPRVGLSLLLLQPTQPTRLVGFSDRVDLGSVGLLRSDPTVAMRITYRHLPEHPPHRLALYLRGTAFDQYDGRAWRRTDVERSTAEHIGLIYPITRLPDPMRDQSLTIDLSPIEPPVLFLPANSVALELLPKTSNVLGLAPALQRGPEGEVRYSQLDDRSGPRYRVFQSTRPEPQPGRLGALDRERYLQLPRDFSPKVQQLARTWAGALRDPARIARRVETKLRSDYTYDLKSPSGLAADPVEDFLLRSKRGHCEYYSTAMALLLRSLGIATRSVTGFVGASYNRFGHFYVVRQGDAHSWVEVWLDGRGWQRFDPTPPASSVPRSALTGWLAVARDLVEAASQRWRRNVEGYDLHQQLGLFRSVRHTMHDLGLDLGSGTGTSHRRWWIGAAVATFGIAVILWWRRRKRAEPSEHRRGDPRGDANQAVQLYRSLERLMSERGAPRPPATPPYAHARSLSELGHPLAGDVQDLTNRYLRARFGDEPLLPHEMAAMTRRIQLLRRSSRAAGAEKS